MPLLVPPSRRPPDPLHCVSVADASTNQGWFRTFGWAAYLGCSVSRVRTLTVTGDLPHERDGSRPLYHRDELDTYVRRGGARCP